MTITTGLHVRVSVSFEDKNACVGGKGKEERGSRDSSPSPSLRIDKLLGSKN